MKKLIALVLFLLSSNLWSAMIIESIQLRHRPAEDIIPIIEPMLAPDARITGTGYKLIIKSTPENLDQIKNLLKDIDIDQNLLRVYVSLGNPTPGARNSGRQSTRTEKQASVSLESRSNSGSISIGRPRPEPETGIAIGNDRSKFTAHIQQTDNMIDRSGTQVMSVSEGYWANISMGQEIPVTTRTRNPDGTVTQSTTYRPVMTGYQVKPRIHDNKVTLSIRPYQQSVTNNATIDSTQMQTTITGNLGEWLLIGSIDQQQNLNNSAIANRSEIRSTDVNEVWVKVVRP